MDKVQQDNDVQETSVRLTSCPVNKMLFFFCLFLGIVIHTLRKM